MFNYAVASKKEAAGNESPRFTSNNSLSLTASTMSIADLLEFVNKNYPEILSMDVLNHFGRSERPIGSPKELGESMLYFERDPDISNRTLLTNALQGTITNADEKAYLLRYQEQIAKLDLNNPPQMVYCSTRRAKNILNKVGNNGYAADVLVGVNREGSAVLYDIIDIKAKKIEDAGLVEINSPSAEKTSSRGDVTTSPNVRQEEFTSVSENSS